MIPSAALGSSGTANRLKQGYYSKANEQYLQAKGVTEIDIQRLISLSLIMNLS